VTQTFYRRPLPDSAIAFSSVEGRRLFAEALATGGLDGYFPLAEQFHTQAEPTFCGLGSLVVALNALAIDPGRLWKGPWRWFGEELLDCCVPLDHVRTRGLDIDELACLARCNGADVTLHRADASTLETWRNALAEGARADAVIVASYDRSALGQTGTGHFSPLGGYHHERDLTLILDVARFKYPPHWVSAEHLWEAMRSIDSTTGKSRGWLTLRARARGVGGLGFSIRCDGDSWRGLVDRLARAATELNASTNASTDASPRASTDRSTDVDALIRAITPLATHVEVRTPSTPAHREAIDHALSALQSLPVYQRVKAIARPDQATVVTFLLLASETLVAPEQRAHLASIVGTVDENSPLGAELQNVRAQLSALWAHLRDAA
jgi:glutathione gamma-glutamylcysteinyltransferase